MLYRRCWSEIKNRPIRRSTSPRVGPQVTGHATSFQAKSRTIEFAHVLPTLSYTTYISSFATYYDLTSSSSFLLAPWVSTKNGAL